MIFLKIRMEETKLNVGGEKKKSFSIFSYKKSTPKVIKVNSFNNHWIRQSLYPGLNYDPVLKTSGVEPTPNLWPAANNTPSACLKILFHPTATYKSYNKEAVHVKTKPKSNLLVASISFVCFHCWGFFVLMFSKAITNYLGLKLLVAVYMQLPVMLEEISHSSHEW